ncbi:GNAT family N-acetyltransferase [uncultured Aquimarina sp.]|uniref:GNAT family N-acetyltransferase n=1 Tax=uncultured Aquimarina sp. TaxID=575652 RepID=UPI0026108A50|nr:GNAT family N-acetyltransferase [uncultured Aquimarina sp.]
MSIEIRKVKKEDIIYLKEVLDSSELFPSHLLDDMISNYFSDASSTDIWFTSIYQEKLVSIGYCAPERLTEGTYNLYAIAVHKDYQGKGIGKQMMDYIENLLQENGHRILIVETSGKLEFELTREFYHKCNYRKQAVIPEFYNKDDDKIVFWKKLQ